MGGSAATTGSTGVGRRAILDETLRRQAIADRAAERLGGTRGLGRCSMKLKSLQERLDKWMGPAFQRPPDPSIVPPGASRAEAQARRALRWYGPSWREAHGDELLATVLDVEANEVQGR